MKRKSLGQLLKLAESLLDECRRAHGEARSELDALEQRHASVVEKRRLVLSGVAGLSAQAVADCTLALDRRESLLVEDIELAGRRVEQARERVQNARQEARALERLAELRDRAEKTKQERAAAARVEDLARSLRHRRQEEEAHELALELR